MQTYRLTIKPSEEHHGCTRWFGAKRPAVEAYGRAVEEFGADQVGLDFVVIRKDLPRGALILAILNDKDWIASEVDARSLVKVPKPPTDPAEAGSS